MWISVTLAKVTVWILGGCADREVRLGFDPSLVRFGFAVDKVVVGQVYLRALRSPSLSISFYQGFMLICSSPTLYNLRY
jgi:hypothetical protein